MSKMVVRHQELDVYKKAFEAAMRIFEISKTFLKEETYSPNRPNSTLVSLDLL